MDAFAFLVSILLGYALGSIPFGLILTQKAGLGDIRKIGSGNIGATNVLRTGHKGLALLTVLLDASKAGIAALICTYLFHNPFFGFCAGAAGVLGHIFPIYLKFKGGKGVASCLGVFVFMTPLIGLLAALTWLLAAKFTKYSSLGAITMFLLTPLYAFLGASSMAGFFYTGLCLLCLYRHKQNIARLLAGTETKIQLRKK